MKPFPAAAALALFLAAPAFAAPVLVNFERSWDYANGDVNGYYGGGTAADGASGANLGITFVNVSGLSNDANFTYYTGAPSMLGTAYAHTFAPEDHAFMNITGGGALNTLAFFYSSPVSVLGAVRAYSGLDGTGSLLGSFDLAASGTAYDVWTAVTLTFAGVARSFDLTGSANAVAIDNIAVNVVPEPSTVLLMLAGGAAVLRQATRRRVKQA